MISNRVLEQAMSSAISAIEAAERQSADLALQHFDGTAADGLVSAVVSGSGEIVKIRILPQARRDMDNISLGEAVVEAVGSAMRQSDECRAQIVRDVTIMGRRAADVLPGLSFPRFGATASGTER